MAHALMSAALKWTLAIAPIGPPSKYGELLATSDCAGAAVHFLEYLTSEDQCLRQYAAWGRGSIAEENCAEPVNRILATEDRKTRTFAVLGIGRALAAKRGEPAFFEAIRGALDEFLYFEMAEFYQIVIEVENQQGTAALSSEETSFFAASRYYFEIQNGGPWQYFGNSTANYHKMIVAGLKGIGAPETAETLAGKFSAQRTIGRSRSTQCNDRCVHRRTTEER
jgi:uncharacterized protein DUF4375